MASIALGRVSICAALTVGVVAILSSSAAVAAVPFDDLPGGTLGDSPYTSATPFDQTVSIGNSETFTVEELEVKAAGAYLACGGWGSKDGWVRFATAVSGKIVLNVSKTTPGDIFYKVFTAPTANPAFLDLTEIGCADGFDGSEETYSFGYDVPANRIVFLQALVECNPTQQCTKQERDEAPGGPTKVRVRFTPDNKDGDAVPDSLDPCPTVSGPFRGCGDGDGDQVGDADDSCPTVFGRGADGCRRPDEDGDGFASSAKGGNDCNDDNSAIGPGVFDGPRNGVDENCDGRDADYPRIGNDVEWVFAYSVSAKRAVGLLKPLKLAGPITNDMRVKLLCSGRGCPFSRQAVPVAKAKPGGLVLGQALVRERLDPGARITLMVTRPGYVGKAIRFTVPKHGKMKVDELCVPVGTETARKVCP